MEDVAVSLDAGKGPIPLLEFLNTGNPGPARDRQINQTNTLFKLINDQKALAACIRSFPAFAISQDSLRTNKRPVLAIVGDLDPFKIYVDQTGKWMPNLKVVIIKGGDHNSTLYAPDFLRELKIFLDEHRESPVIPKTEKAKAA